MSTDTAFALGMLALVGPRFPDRLRAFLLTVAIVDDVIALTVIALVYSDHIVAGPLLVALAVLALILVMRSLGIRSACRTRCSAWRPGWRSRVGNRPDRGRVGARPAGVRVAGRARRPGARHRPVPCVPRAATPELARSGPVGRPHRHLAERAPAGGVPPLDELRDRAAVRPGERRHRDRRRLPLARVHVDHHARHPDRLRGGQADRRRRHRRGWSPSSAAAGCGRRSDGRPSSAAERSPASDSPCRS